MMVKRIKKSQRGMPRFEYKMRCDICGVRVGRKKRIWSYRNERTGKMEARCKKHLKVRRG